ncbi:hypothetical protein B0A49_06569 [Cryomyces minteri]|uniref:ATP-dependent RNA helicase ucp12 n=1 Tax=Cryomyces minteri TaxID=331657 RepID=A0A4U0XG66_9PEZI|nr:hypothetical protein B0A49_06569 [Cryomyces minteri]
MPKNAHGPRHGAGHKKPAPAAPTGDDTSYIVFSNSKSDPKKKSKPVDDAANTAMADKTKAKDTAAGVETPPADAPKKPDTRTLIGGASWTGKLPMNLLSEHCQKQRWEKPEYTMSKTSEGFSSAVVLKSKNLKTQEMTSLPPFHLPPGCKQLAAQPTAVEARHFAATYALFRVCNMRNIHMMLPPNYRDLWKGDFADIKAEDVKEGRGWMYEADPFQAKRERDEAHALMEKRRAEHQKQKAKESSLPAVPGGVPGQSSGKGGNLMRGWNKAPKIEMGKRIRKDVETLIRRKGVWNPHGVTISTAYRNQVVEELVTLGFRRSHIEEAAEICKDREEILEWLLIHVPEDDLPSWSLPEGYVAGISMASGDLKREAKVERLATAGYAVELCEEMLDAAGGDEALAAGVLQKRLLGAESGDVTPSDVSSLRIANGTTDDSEAWNEEQEVLVSIYGDRYRREKSIPDVCKIPLRLGKGFEKDVTLQVRKAQHGYPNTLPTISILARLPAYIRLSIIKRALLAAQSDFLGEPMIFNLVDWLEREIPGICDNPGKLTDVSSVASGGAETGRTSTVRQHGQRKRKPKPISWRPYTDLSQRMLEQWQSKQESPAQQRMMRVRQSLPAWKLQEAIVQAVNANQVVIISGETGSGKSTQSVQFVLDDMIKKGLGEAANIICTQPRRISAIGLADRVADERCSTVGDEVGYAIRGESRQRPGSTKITFVTTGVLLRRLQTSGGRTQDVLDALADVSHVVVDEVHERSLDTDFLLVLLRNVLASRKDLKLILMSATLDAEVFEAYFRRNATVGRIEIEGRTHPVTDYYVDDVVRMTAFNGYAGDDGFEDEEPAKNALAGALRTIGMKINYELIAQTIRYIDQELGDQDGGILVFLPGTMEIDNTLRILRAQPNLHVLPLHASLQSVEQRRVFPPPPRGKRKVIAATNVAETSITIEDIVAVIDTGRVKETSFDPQNSMVKLEEVWASRAACKQRRGRAGRVRAGKCYKLYTRNAEMTKMMERPEPEIRRVPLEQLCLSVKAMGVVDVPAFLASALTPPETVAVQGAIDLLGRMGALDGAELTALGRHLAMIPADLRCGKLLVYGATFGCLEACLTIAAILTVRSPFLSPQGKRDEAKAARSAFGKGQGDLLCDLGAYDEWAERRYGSYQPRDVRAWCEQNFLSAQTLSDISSNRSQYLSSLKEIGFLPLSYHPTASPSSSPYNRHAANAALVRALIAAAFAPQTARIELPDKKFAATVSGAMELDPEARTIKYFGADGGRVFVHPSSTLFDAQGFAGGASFVAYFNKMATSKLSTPTRPCSSPAPPRSTRWAVAWWSTAGCALAGRLRALLDDRLARKIDDPPAPLDDGDEGGVVDLVRRLVELDGLDR